MNKLTDDNTPTKFTFYANGSNGTFSRSFENKEEVWHVALYEFTRFLKGMGYIINNDMIQIKDYFADEDEPDYITLFDAASRTW